MENLEQMRKNFEKAVADYVAVFLKQFELDESDCWWVGDRIGVDNFCFGDFYAISLNEMIYCIENGVTYDEFVAHMDYLLKCDEYNFPLMNLKAWHTGAPRIPQETFDRLDGLKRDLDEAIKNEREKF